MISPLQFLAGWFGYAKIPVAVVQLAVRIAEMARKTGDAELIRGAETLERFLRSCRKLGR